MQPDTQEDGRHDAAVSIAPLSVLFTKLFIYNSLDMVEAAGVETLVNDLRNWLMAHEFWV
ncbi:MAG: hypothetical protein Q7R30_04745 [Acidobacteriota bacterium]|nr:hypothetical protein [Acidobacteriota bacterium]